MTSPLPPDQQPAGAAPAADDTAAFQRFYRAQPSPDRDSPDRDGSDRDGSDRHGTLHRLLVGWWRKGR